MTVSSTTNRKTYTGDGSTTSFGTSPVVFFDTGDLTLYDVTTATGDSSTLVENTDYTVTGGDGSTGTVDLTGGSDPYGAPSSAQKLVILRDLDITQEVDFVNNEATDAEVAEDALDRLTMIAQQLDAANDRAAALADSDVSGADVTLPTPVAGAILGWDDDGLALQNYSTSDIGADIAVSSFMETVLDDSGGSTAFQSLVSDATAETAPASGDLIMLSDISLTPDDGRKMTLGNVLKVVGDLTEDTSPDLAADYALTYDASASAAKKVLLGRVGAGVLTAQVASTSGTSVDFTSIPSWATEITIQFVGVSTNGSSNPIVQIGDSGGIETTGYLGASISLPNGGATVGTNPTTGFGVLGAIGASTVFHGTMVLTLQNAAGFKWAASCICGHSDAAQASVSAGTKATSAALDRVRVTMVNGTDTFDAGAISLLYR